MINKNTVYAIIPARGGSKGIPRKNIVDFGGKPLISYTIEAALHSKYVDKVVVSTDDPEIAEVSKNYNADVPFLRPSEISTDEASSNDVILHALDYFKSKNIFMPDIILILQPTSPLRLTEDIDNALEKFIKSGAKVLKSVTKTEISPYWFKKLDEKSMMKDFIKPETAYIRRQDTPDLYILNGAIYIYYSNDVLSAKMLLDKDVVAYIMPQNRSVDIDNIIDLKLAELLLKGKHLD